MSGTPKEPTWEEIFQKAKTRALYGGIPGAMAMIVQVTTLMWLRTTMNFQYRHGTDTKTALKKLYSQGGVRRFYRGYGPAIFQGPLSRFGDTAANAGVLGFFDANPNTKDLPIAVKTFFASCMAGPWRVFLMPIDTCKTILQVEGVKGLSVLGKKVKTNGPFVFYHGALGAWAATAIGHFPWFVTNNELTHRLPTPDNLWAKLGRNAGIGFISSVISDCCSNSLRVLKTYRQTSEVAISYSQAMNNVIKNEGVMGLLGRGLKTRILSNGLNGCLFNIMWRGISEVLETKKVFG
eukprot:TRINITY_DN47_c0_g1_i1.p1 TRINITY_DN47_c0_g1~~TRINITY_DN47_c0_g1_i1.p1  ORF type:complete len:293 (-),score=58.37 TRINITY_DN47_c0_g1_i1:58-936(-)